MRSCGGIVVKRMSGFSWRGGGGDDDHEKARNIAQRKLEQEEMKYIVSASRKMGVVRDNVGAAGALGSGEGMKR